MSGSTAARPGRDDIAALAKGGRTNVFGFILRLSARIPFLFVAGRLYGAATVGRFALAVVVVELAALAATLGMKRGLAQALAKTDRPHAHVVWDALVVALAASLCASGVLFAFPEIMFPKGAAIGFEQWLPGIVFAIAWSDLSLAALAYRDNVRATVTARAVIEPWTISIAATLLWFVMPADGLEMAYALSMLAAMIASIVPFVREYGLPKGWRPNFWQIIALARRNMPLAGADAIEWATRNVDRFILGQLFPPAVVGIYYMAQQIASLPGRLKTSFDPILGPVIARSLARGDRAAIAKQVRQVAFWIMVPQGCLALMGSIPGGAVMGVIGPQFVPGAASLGFLLTAEVIATMGAVSESALVYIARHWNLMVSLAMLGVQVLVSLAFIEVIKALGWPIAAQAAGPAAALCLSVAITSIIKSRLLGHLLKAPISAWRWPLIGAAMVAGGVGYLFTLLPHRLEWAELSFGLPAIIVTYFAVLWRWGFEPEDKALFRRRGRIEPAIS
ncbi:lipopolysaccharide biosynthesis protein [Sphingomonas sp. GlSt437]|uniref:lipopolysaccharide biosynthesis protein n=1 Tax=Sphingomonas sp. GlSt437 TaxID=3389970 RepID=UPI003A8A82AC